MFAVVHGLPVAFVQLVRDFSRLSRAPGQPMPSFKSRLRVFIFRVSGHLYFTNVEKADQDGGTGTGDAVTYKCTAYNKIMRREVAGEDQKIIVIGSKYNSPGNSHHS